MKFTLIELLVVVAIILILMAILLPSLKGARESAKELLCRSNQRQLAIALINYAGDYNGRFPTRHKDASPTGCNTNEWMCICTHSPGSGHGANNPHNGFFPSYFKSYKGFYCPSLSDKGITFGSSKLYPADPAMNLGGWPYLAAGYMFMYNVGYYNYYLPQDMNPGAWPDATTAYNYCNNDPGLLRSSPKRVIILDWASPETNAWSHYISAHTFGGKGGLNSQPPGLKGANMAYIDGHVRWITRTQITGTQVMKACGWYYGPGPEQ